MSIQSDKNREWNNHKHNWFEFCRIGRKQTPIIRCKICPALHIGDVKYFIYPKLTNLNPHPKDDKK